jgi:two-component system response regulator
MNNLNEVEVLLVEDNASDAELTQRALKKNRLSSLIEVVTDGEEALGFIFSRGRYSERDMSLGPRLILLDLKLPLVSGLEVLKEIKNDARTKAIPVVVLTSSAEDSDICESYQLGANSYIVKPFDFDDYSKAVAEVGKYWLLLNKISFK